MARDRKRAKQRRQRQERQAARSKPGREQAPLAVERRPTESPPEPAEEISADAELAKEAARGAPTEEVDSPADDRDAGVEIYEDELTDDAGSGVLSDLVDRDVDLEEDESELAVEEPAPADGEGRGGGGGRAAAAEAMGRPVPGRPARREGNPVIAFLRACWAELQRVQWPDRRHVAQATGVVLGFVVLAGGYLGLLDFVWQEVVSYLLDF